MQSEAALWNAGPSLRNVHRVILRSEASQSTAACVIDDATGNVLAHKRLTASIDGSGNVFDPNPLNFSPVQPNGTFTNATSDGTLGGRMVNLPLLGITQNGANFVLTGPYVQIAEIEPPTTAPPSVATANGFTFARSNPSAPPTPTAPSTRPRATSTARWASRT